MSEEKKINPYRKYVDVGLAIGASGLGSGIGFGGAMLADHIAKKNGVKVNPNTLKVVLPLLGLGSSLGAVYFRNRLEKRLRDE